MTILLRIQMASRAGTADLGEGPPLVTLIAVFSVLYGHGHGGWGFFTLAAQGVDLFDGLK